MWFLARGCLGLESRFILLLLSSNPSLPYNHKSHVANKRIYATRRVALDEHYIDNIHFFHVSNNFNWTWKLESMLPWNLSMT